MSKPEAEATARPWELGGLSPEVAAQANYQHYLHELDRNAKLKASHEKLVRALGRLVAATRYGAGAGLTVVGARAEAESVLAEIRKGGL